MVTVTFKLQCNLSTQNTVFYMYMKYLICVKNNDNILNIWYILFQWSQALWKLFYTCHYLYKKCIFELLQCKECRDLAPPPPQLAYCTDNMQVLIMTEMVKRTWTKKNKHVKFGQFIHNFDLFVQLMWNFEK